MTVLQWPDDVPTCFYSLDLEIDANDVEAINNGLIDNKTLKFVVSLVTVHCCLFNVLAYLFS